MSKITDISQIDGPSILTDIKLTPRKKNIVIVVMQTVQSINVGLRLSLQFLY